MDLNLDYPVKERKKEKKKERKKERKKESEVAQLCLTLCDPMDAMGFPRQKYSSGLPFPFPEDLSDPGIEPGSPTLLVYSLPSAREAQLSSGSIRVRGEVTRKRRSGCCDHWL